MPTTITGTDGVSQVQTGAVESGDLPAGSVIQVVQEEFLGANTGEIVTNSTSYVDSNISASITPQFTTSKILICCVLGGTFKAQSDTSLVTNISRGTTQLFETVGLYTNSSEFLAGSSTTMIFLDTPSTVSPVAYKIQFKSANGGNVVINGNLFGNQGNSNITLMEIAG